MSDTEARLSAQLRAELDRIEPSRSSWEVIRNGSALQLRDDVARPRSWRSPIAAAAVLVLTLLGGLLAARGTDGGGHSAVTAVGSAADQLTDDRAGAGRVRDVVGDASTPHLDLTDVEVRRVQGSVRIMWALAGPIPAEPPPVEYRVTFGASDQRGSPVVVFVRLDGPDGALGAATCGLGAQNRPICAGRPVTLIDTPLEIDGDTITATVPVQDLGAEIDDSLWTAEVLQPT